MSKYKQVLQNLGYIENTNDNSIVQNLLKIPRKDKRTETIHTTCPTENYIHQIDTLFLPEDNTKDPTKVELHKKELKMINMLRIKSKEKPIKKERGYRYCLVVVDISTGKCDAEPLIYKNAFIARDALKRIYQRKILTLPHEIECDAGSEFKNVFLEYFNTVSHVRTKIAGRHRAQAVVESVNGVISKLIQTRMISEEINTREFSTEWIEDLPKIVFQINKYFSHLPPELNLEKQVPIRVKSNSVASNIIPIDTPVRYQLDNPKDVTTGKRLFGKFRVGDIRWSEKVCKITRIYLRPDQPPMYKVDNLDCAFTRNQIQIVDATEKAPPTKTQKKFVIEKILSKTKVKNKVFYEVKWSSGEITTEPRTSLVEDVPDLIQEFEKKK
jgi:hypothetical protein